MTDYSADEMQKHYDMLPRPLREQVSRFIERQVEFAARSSDQSGASRPANLTHRTTGRLIFDDGPDVKDSSPLHNIKVELWDQNSGHRKQLGNGSTDRDGYFEIWYDPNDVPGKDSLAVQIRVYDQDHAYRPDGFLVLHDKLIFVFDGDDDVAKEHYDFGELDVPFWIYDAKKQVARIRVVEHGSLPQSYSPARSVMLIKYAARVELQNALHHAEHALNQHLPTQHQIQNSYPKNKTLRIEKERPGYTRSDEYFGERILNGMSASVLDKDPTNFDRYWLHTHWTSYDQGDVYAMPNVDVWFELQNEKMMPLEIALQFRKRGCQGENAPLESPVHFTPSDGPRWLQAKRLARVGVALRTELDTHLAETHLNIEQYAIACYRNFRRSPLRYLLAPHMKEVILINRDAEERLLRKNSYFDQATGLTQESIRTRIRQTMGTLDWKNWEPRRVLCEQHIYAKAAGLYWEMLSEYVDFFFEQYQTELQEHWYEVHRFSKDIVQHSAPVYLCPYLRSRLDRKTGTIGKWFEPNERMDWSVQREVVGGVERAIQPVTRSDDCDVESLENMKQVCRYVIFHATFKHTYTNSRQYDDGGELLYGGIGLRHGKHGVLSPEKDHSTLQPPDVASDQLWFAWMLSNSCYGFIVKNEDQDIHPRLIQMLHKRRSAFKDLGVDINAIQSRINI